MKTYLKRPYEKSLAAIYYSSADTLHHFPSSVNFRQRIVQPSTKEQRRLLSSSSSPRLQHVHSGKYGIRPIWPSDELLCEQWQHGRKSSKVMITLETAQGYADTLCLHDTQRMIRSILMRSLSTYRFLLIS